jgi:hypothetical protein
MQISEKLNITVLFFAYAILLGAMYLFAFWRPFGFSIFPYLSLQDYISPPLNGVIVLLVFPLLAFPVWLQTLQFSLATLKNYIVILLVIYSLLALFFFIGGVQLLIKHSFQYRNENSVLIVIVFLILLPWLGAIVARASPHHMHILLLSLALAQFSTVLSIGYSHGKTVFNGAEEVHFLDTREVCEKEGIHPWVLLGRFTNSTIFMNAIDKRLCITGEKNYRIVSRKIIEDPKSSIAQ